MSTFIVTKITEKFNIINDAVLSRESHIEILSCSLPVGEFYVN